MHIVVEAVRHIADDFVEGVVAVCGERVDFGSETEVVRLDLLGEQPDPGFVDGTGRWILQGPAVLRGLHGLLTTIEAVERVREQHDAEADATEVFDQLLVLVVVGLFQREAGGEGIPRHFALDEDILAVGGHLLAVLDGAFDGRHRNDEKEAHAVRPRRRVRGVVGEAGHYGADAGFAALDAARIGDRDERDECQQGEGGEGQSVAHS